MTLDYLRLTGRSAERIALVEAYCKENMLWHDPSEHATYSQVVELDLGDVEPSLAGPRRPQDRVPLRDAKRAFLETLGTFGVDYATARTTGRSPTRSPPPTRRPSSSRAASPSPEPTTRRRDRRAARRITRTPVAGADYELDHGSVVIAAITSCTNTSNPQVMVAAGLLARNAVERGPAAQAVGEVVARAGLEGRHAVLRAGRACRSTSTRSASTPSATAARPASATPGRCADEISAAIADGDLVVCSVLSGNRNFEARIHPEVKANYLASPPLVVAYALAGRMDIDFETEPIGTGSDGEDVFLRDIWPSAQEIGDTIATSVAGEHVRARPTRTSSPATTPGASLPVPEGELFAWEPDSTYVRQPPYFEGMRREPGRSATSTARAASSGSATRSRPTTSRPPASIRLDSPAGALPHRARRRAQGLQLLRRAARQPRGDGARHVRERPAAQPARARARREPGRCTSRRARR